MATIDWSTLLRPCAIRLALKVGDDQRILNLAAAGLARQHHDHLAGLSLSDLGQRTPPAISIGT